MSATAPAAPAAAPQACEPLRLWGLQGRALWALYWGFWLAVGIALAVAEHQHPQPPPGRRAWEPFLNEITSLLVVGALALAVYRGVDALTRRRRGFVIAALAHAAGAAAFGIVHVGAMYALRWPFYALLAGVNYAPMSPWRALRFEGAKDVVTYVVVALLCWGLVLLRREQAQRLHAARAQALLLELQLARLADQLQPHFLFNCLNSIAALVEENPKAAVTMIARVGSFLRSALQHEGDTMTTLDDELSLVRDYLAIQSLRFEDRIALRSEVPPPLGRARLPRLVLQPVVENAVKHGLVRPDVPLELRLRAAVQGGQLVVTLANPLPDAAKSEGAGIGLDLTRRRLALLYGDTASLDAAPQADGAFVVSLSLPLDLAGVGLAEPAHA